MRNKKLTVLPSYHLLHNHVKERKQLFGQIRDGLHNEEIQKGAD